jgi:malonyl CoA-acyl carrier protein transacylase
MDEQARTGTGIVFPGMAPSRFADVGRFMLINPFARRLIAAADDRLGYSLLDRFRDNDGDYTEYAQVGFMVNCLALAEWAEQELGVTPDLATGPSFGEKPAAVYIGSLPFEDGVWMTAALARCMAEFFATEYQDVVTHSFVRTPQERIREVLAELEALGEWHDISCYVDHNFYMVSLRERNLEWLQRKVRSIGGVSLYTMRPPMHSSAFDALRRKAEEEVLGRLAFADPKLPLIADQDGAVVRSGAGVLAMLLSSFTRPLRWPAVVDSMKRLGVGTVCVSGPDSLFGRVPCTTSNFEVIAVTPRVAMRPRRGGAIPA